MHLPRRKAKATATAPIPVRAPRLWAIDATVEVRTRKGWTSARNLPTFYLDPNVQGIMNERHAIKIAMTIVGTGATVSYVHAEPIF